MSPSKNSSDDEALAKELVASYEKIKEQVHQVIVGQEKVLEQRELLMKESQSEMQDADLAEIVTRLQSLMVSRDAAQKAFSMIGQQSLFDFIR